MDSLAAVLAKYGDDVPEFGGRKPITTDALHDELRQVRDRNGRIVWFCIAMLGMIFVGAAALVVASLDKPSRVVAVFTATGVSMPWLIRTMMDVWKQKVASDLILAMVSTLKPEVSRSIVEVAARQLYGPPQATRRAKRRRQ